MAGAEAFFMYIGYPLLGKNNYGYSALLIAGGVVLYLNRTHARFFVPTLITVFLLGGLYLCNSRSVTVGLVFSLLFLYRCNLSRKIIGAIVGMVLFWVLLWPENVAQFFEILKNPDEIKGRIVIWETALMAIKSNPLFGFGLGNFETAYLQFQQPSHDILRFSRTTSFAHNDFLQLASTAGLPALIFLMIFFGKVLVSTPLRKNPEPLSVLIIFFSHALFNFSVYLPLHGLILSGFIGILLSGSREKKMKIDSKFILLPLFLAPFLIFYAASEIARKRENYSLAAQLMPIRSDIWYEWALQDQNPKDTLLKLEHALKWNASDAFAWSRLARHLRAHEPKNRHRIESSFEKSIQLAPYHAPFQIDAGFHYLSINDNQKAKDNFTRAAHLEPNAALPRLALSLVYLKENKRSQAKKMLLMALNLEKKYAALSSSSPYARYLMLLDQELVIRLKTVLL